MVVPAFDNGTAEVSVGVGETQKIPRYRSVRDIAGLAYRTPRGSGLGLPNIPWCHSNSIFGRTIAVACQGLPPLAEKLVA